VSEYVVNMNMQQSGLVDPPAPTQYMEDADWDNDGLDAEGIS
jgi:hypothetical protein